MASQPPSEEPAAAPVVPEAATVPEPPPTAEQGAAAPLTEEEALHRERLLEEVACLLAEMATYGQGGAAPRIDPPPEEMGKALVPIRTRLKQRIEDQLRSYDRSMRFPRLEDAVHWNRDYYEVHLRSEVLKEMRASIERFCKQGTIRQLWRVVGGVDKGGLVVRMGEELSSAEEASRLATDSIVEELEVLRDRLHYKLISGSGPETGWVTLRVSQRGLMKQLAVKVTQDNWTSKDADRREPVLARVLPRPQHFVIVALMAVHLSSFQRLRRFQHVLRSIELQKLPEDGAVELVVSLSWSAATPDLVEATEEVVKGFVANRLLQASCGDKEDPRPASVARGPLTVAICQTTRHSQFQHMRAATNAVAEALRRRWANAESKLRSVWAIFGDDDDIWHERRVAEYANAIRIHAMLDGVAIFATTCRVVCKEGAEMHESGMPVEQKQIDDFIASGRGKRMDREPPSKAWFKRLTSAGTTGASHIPVDSDLALEYFHLCPRLRILQEFFAGTSELLLAHRYCDLCLAEFLQQYPRRGEELGLELAFFEADCWMYFYACPASDVNQWSRSLEEDPEEELQGFPPVSVGIDGHMATEIQIERSEIDLAEKVCSEFQAFEKALTVSQLTKYWASFRNWMELVLVPRHHYKVDQRTFDAGVFTAVNVSFGQFAEKVLSMPHSDGERAARMMFRVGQGFAKSLARSFDVSVLWHFPNEFMEPAIEDDTYAQPDYYAMGVQVPWGQTKAGHFVQPYAGHFVQPHWGHHFAHTAYQPGHYYQPQIPKPYMGHVNGAYPYHKPYAQVPAWHKGVGKGQGKKGGFGGFYQPGKAAYGYGAHGGYGANHAYGTKYQGYGHPKVKW